MDLLKMRARQTLTVAVMVIGVVFSSLPAALALDVRFIDIAQISWSGASSPSASTLDVQNSLTTVEKNWRSFTAIEGDTRDRSISFVYGQTLGTPILLNSRFQCDSIGFSSTVNSLRSTIYTRLGIAESKDRYLLILTPNAGCVWMGKALIGQSKVKGGTMVLHNTANPFVITHELGHTLGLGHSNLLRCRSGAKDGPWSADCRGVEYGGSIDVMGNVDTSSPLSVYHQWRLGLLDESDIYQSWLTEKVTLNASDLAGRTRAVFVRDGAAAYWIEYRRPKPGATYNPGIVIYRSDPPPSAFIDSPNPADLFALNPGPEVTADIWMLNLDSYDYSSSGGVRGSMTLPQGRTISLFSTKVTISFALGADANSVELNIERTADTSPPPQPRIAKLTQQLNSETEILQSGYDDAESAIAYFEMKRGDQLTKILGSAPTNPIFSYQNPFIPPKTLRLSDLPEGKYRLAIRAIDVWGNASIWSDEQDVLIDRTVPVFSAKLVISQATSERVVISLPGLMDEATGLCDTNLVNPEGLVVARSSASSAPELSLTNLTSRATLLKTFDCSGNGKSADFSYSASFKSAKSAKRTGKWSALAAAPGALRCSGKCSATFSASGTVRVLLGSGSATLSIGKSQVGVIGGAKSRKQRLSLPVEIGASKRTLKIEGENLVLYGLSQFDYEISNLTDTTRASIETDLSLSDPIQSELSQRGFRQSDFDQGWRVSPMVSGTTLRDPSLDLCSAEFLSEKERVSRRQVIATKSDSPYIFLSTETVRYRNEASAQLALSELIKRANDCVEKGGGIESGGDFVKYDFQNFPGETRKVLISPQSIFVRATIGEGVSARQLLGFYQFKDDLLTGLYIVRPADKPFSDFEVVGWRQVATLLGERLSQSGP